jgi:hypothetical protein
MQVRHRVYYLYSRRLNSSKFNFLFQLPCVPCSFSRCSQDQKLIKIENILLEIQQLLAGFDQVFYRKQIYLLIVFVKHLLFGPQRCLNFIKSKLIVLLGLCIHQYFDVGKIENSHINSSATNRESWSILS